jgi:E3 ubiquitin-protein ligase BRE1
MQLVSENVKAKQLHSTLLSEKQALADQLQQINSLIENSKIANSEEEVLFSCYLDHYLYILF